MRFASIIACLISTLALGCIGPNCNSITGSCKKVTKADDCDFAKTHFIARAAGQQYLIYGGSLAQRYINLPDKCSTYGVIDTTVVYEQTAQPARLSSYFANADGTLTLGQVSNALKDIRAVDLGLSLKNYLGTFCVHPSIRNVVINFDGWVGFDGWVRGLYARARLPITYSRWNITLTNNNSAVGFVEQFPDGFIAPVGTDTFSLSSGPVALNGQQKIGDMPRLDYGRICAPDAQWSIADIPCDIGYNPVLTQRARVGGSLHVVIPTGTKDDGHCLFKPRVGYGRWQLGAQLGAQYTLSAHDQSSCTLYVEAMVSALLKTRDRRLLGLRANDTYAFNHYLLLNKFEVQNNAINPNSVSLERAANLLFQCLPIKTTINSDVAAWLGYQHGCYRFELGWQFVGRGADRVAYESQSSTVCTADGCPIQPYDCASFGCGNSIYLIKGDAYEYNDPNNTIGYAKADSDIKTLGTTILNTDSLATIRNAALTCADVTVTPALQGSYITNALVVSAGYEFTHERFTPFVGIGGFYEFGSRTCTMDMWGLFAKGGCGF